MREKQYQDFIFSMEKLHKENTALLQHTHQQHKLEWERQETAHVSDREVGVVVCSLEKRFHDFFFSVRKSSHNSNSSAFPLTLASTSAASFFSSALASSTSFSA